MTIISFQLLWWAAVPGVDGKKEREEDEEDAALRCCLHFLSGSRGHK